MSFQGQNDASDGAAGLSIQDFLLIMFNNVMFLRYEGLKYV